MTEDKRVALGVAGILALALSLRGSGLTRSLWYDEVWSTSVVLDSPITLLVNTFVDLHPPLYSYFMYLWIGLMGDGEAIVRLPPLIFALASLALSYAVASRFGGARAGFVTALMLCFSPVHIWYSTEARAYAFGMFLVLLATLSYYKMVDDPEDRRYLRLYAACILAAAFTHYFLIVYVGVFTLLAMQAPGRLRSQVLRIHSAAFLAFAVFFVVKNVLAPLPTDSPHLRPFTLGEMYRLFFGWFLFGDMASPWGNGGQPVVLSAAQVPFWFLFARGALRADSRAGGRLDLALFLFALPVGLLVASHSGGGRVFLERSLFVLQPFFFMLLSRGATGFRHRWLEAASLAAIGIAITASFTRFHARSVAYSPTPDWRAAGAYFRSELESGDAPRRIFVSSPAIALTYYEPRIVTYFGLDRDWDRESAQSLVSPATFRLDLARRVAESYSDQKRRRLQSAVAEIHLVSPREFSEALRVERPYAFYLLNDAFWSLHFASLLSAAEREPGFRLLERHSVRGITIYKCVLAERT